MLTALEFRLRKQGYSIVRAEDGKIAKEKIVSEKPDLIVSDIMMPYITGLELIDYIRKELKSNLPVIVISALEQDEVVLEAFRIGVSDFITKPFKPDELIIRIKRIFQDDNNTQPQAYTTNP